VRDQDNESRTRPATKAEVLFSERFWRNRKGEAVAVEIKRLDGTAEILDIRQWFTATDGALRPTGRGVCMALRKLPDIKRSVDKALKAARDLGLLEHEGEP
jgi:hypothetical protein